MKLENPQNVDQLERHANGQRSPGGIVKLEKLKNDDQLNAPSTANAHASGTMKLENSKNVDQLVWPAIAAHLCVKHCCLKSQIAKSKILLQSPGVLQHSSPGGGSFFRSPLNLITH